MNNKLTNMVKSCYGRQLVVLTGLIAFSTTILASPFERIISFGDSLSDSGFAFASTDGILPPEYRYPLGDGCASDGPVWAEYLADDLDAELINYAFFGAMTNDDNYNQPLFPPAYNLVGFWEEVTFYLTDLGDEKISNKDLFTVMIGANDFFASADPAVILQGVQNTIMGISLLADAGAKHIIVMNVPDLSLTPAIQLGGGNPAAVQALVAFYNSYLAEGLAMVEETYKCKIVQVDTFTILQDIVSDPGAYGLVFVDIPVVHPVTYAYTGVPAELSLFWDGVHPTTVGHRVIADEILDSFLDAYVPGEAIGLDRNVPGWVRR